MGGLKRNLCFWAMTFEKQMLSMFAGLVVYVVVLMLIGGTSREDMVHSFLGYIWIYVCIGVFINGFAAVNTYFPLSVSLGSTRSASYTAMQAMQHIFLVQNMLLAAVIYYFLDRALFFNLMSQGLIIIGLLLILVGLSNLCCLCSVKLGKGIGIAVYICSLVLVMLLFLLFIMSVEGGRNVFMEVARGFFNKPGLFFIGILLDLVSGAIFYRVMKKQDLQF